jgi:predicted nucleic acid-binding protein
MPLLVTAVKVISVVTVGELRAGAIKAGWGEPKRNELEATIRAYPRVDVDNEIAGIWAELQAECLRLGRNAGLNDLWIAATAVRLGCPVAALDDDFARIPGIRLLDAGGVVVETT